MLFERVCREHGITAKLTRPYSPTTTGKVERWHQTLRRELLDTAGPFADLPSAQAAISGWVHAYNHSRPHQGIGMAVPASLFGPGTLPDLAAVVPAPRAASEPPHPVAGLPGGAGPGIRAAGPVQLPRYPRPRCQPDLHRGRPPALRGDRCWEIRSAGKGSKGERWYAWACIAASSARHCLLVRRHIRTGELAFR